MLRRIASLTTLALALAAFAAAQEPSAPPPGAASAPSHSGSRKHHVSKHDRDEARSLFLDGAKELQHNDSRAAMKTFSRAAALDPGTRKYALSEEIARQHVVTDLVQQADKAKILGHFDEARARIREAYHVDPSDPVVLQHLDELASATVAGEPAVRSEVDAAAPPIELQPKPGRLSFHLRATERDLISQVLPAFGIHPTLDDSVGTETVRYDVDDVDFATAMRTLSLVTGTFVVPLDPERALIAKDTKSNHEKYERLAMETVYLPGLAPEQVSEMVNIAKNTFAAKSAIAVTGRSAMTVRAPAPELAALNATLTSLMEGRSELQLDVRMYEIDRTKATNLGMILPTQTNLFNVYSEARTLLQNNSSLVQQIISSGLAAPGDWEAILGILVASGQVSSGILSQPFGIFGGGLTMTGISYSGGSLNMQLNSSDVHAVDQMELRVLDKEEGTIRVGERYPIETSSYSSLSATPLSIPGLSNPGLSSTLQNLGVNLSSLESAASATIPQVQYQDIGLTLTVTPHIDGANDVSLKLDLKLSSLAGSSLNGLPLLANREFSAITSLHVGESTILVSALSRQESDTITGVPGLSDIPGFQDTTNKDTNLDYSELAVVITPHIVRSPHQQATEKMVLLPHQP